MAQTVNTNQFQQPERAPDPPPSRGYLPLVMDEHFQPETEMVILPRKAEKKQRKTVAKGGKSK